ncbi:Glycosyl phosphatidyl inositol protein transamidase complex subunit [Sorochytrium milnesiophthora]
MLGIFKKLFSPDSRELARLQRRRKGLSLLRRFAFPLSCLAFIGGFIGLFVLPREELRRNTYFSENALMPGQVLTYYSMSDWQYMSDHEQAALDLRNGSGYDRALFIRDRLEEMNLDAHIQSYHAPFEDKQRYNTYGVLRAPKGSGAESLLLSAAWESKEHDFNSHGVLFVLSMAQLWKRYSYWDKDIILLFPDHDPYGSAAWVSAYHGQAGFNGIRSDALLTRAGQIQAAVSVDLKSRMYHGGLSLHYEGLNGQLPNLDMINVLVYAARMYEVPLTLHGPGLGDASDNDYWASLQRLTYGMTNLALSRAQGNHAVFKQFGIDAVSLEAIGYPANHRSLSIKSLGSALGSAFRSFNNLLERFHQSFFFYLLTSKDHFISIGVYIPSVIVLCVSLILNAAYSKSVAAKLVAQGPNDAAARQEKIASYTMYPRDVISPLMLLAIVHAMGAVILRWPNALLPAGVVMSNGYWEPRRADVQLALMAVGAAVTVLWVYPRLYRLVHKRDATSPRTQHIHQQLAWRLLKSLTQSITATILLSLSTINFSLAILLAGVTTPLYFFLSPRRSLVLRILQIALVVGVSPLALVLGAELLLPTSMAASGSVIQAVRNAEADWRHSGNWLWPILCVFYFPLNTAYLTLVTFF